MKLLYDDRYEFCRCQTRQTNINYNVELDFAMYLGL